MNGYDNYLELINSLNDPYLEISGSGEILLHNSALRELVDDATGKQIFDLVGCDDRSRLIDLFSQAKSTGEHYEMRCELLPLQGNPVPIKISLTSIQKGDSQGDDCLRCRMYIVSKRYDSDNGLFDTERALKKQTKELAILIRLSEGISSSLELDEILQSICREMVNVFDARNTGIALLNDSQTTLQVVAFHTEHPDESDVTGLEIPIEGNDASLFVIKTGEPIVVPDAQRNPITNSLHDVMVRRGTTCLLVVPLLTRGEVIGTIGIPSESQTVFSQEDVQLAMTIAGQIAGAIDNARLHQTVQKARDVAEQELEIGRRIQIGFFPESLPQITGWELFSYFQSARQVAGDFYDAFPLDQNKKLALVLADVCDKGLGAALFMVLFRSLLRANIQQCFDDEICSGATHGESIVEAVRKTNNYIATNHAQASMFATVFIAVLQRDQGEVWYANCGHDPPLIVRTDGHSERLMPTNPAIGMFPDLDLASKCIKLRTGDSLIAFTDGVSDACSVDGRSFGEERLLKILVEKSPLKHRLDYLTTELVRHTNGAEQYDDITCIAFNRS
jgi:sigma-B regulation protein RsbU (phosphoserine phosphatase)